MNEENRIQGTNELITLLRLDIREINTKMDGFKDVSRKVDEVVIEANKAMQSSDSAHKRLDKIDKVIWWVATSIIGSVIIGVLTLLYSTKGA